MAAGGAFWILRRFRRKFGVRRPFAIYIGRIDENKGCAELFSHFQRYAATYPNGLDLLLVGSSVMPVPKHPRIRHLGYRFLGNSLFCSRLFSHRISSQ